jgi:hypothetical protein
MHWYSPQQDTRIHILLKECLKIECSELSTFSKDRIKGVEFRKHTLDFVRNIYYTIQTYIYIYSLRRLRITLLGPCILIENAPVSFNWYVVITNTYVMPPLRRILSRNCKSEPLSSSAWSKFSNGLSGLNVFL